MSVGQHTESIYDNHSGNWFEKSLTLIEADGTISTEGVPGLLVFELGVGHPQAERRSRSSLRQSQLVTDIHVWNLYYIWDEGRSGQVDIYDFCDYGFRAQRHLHVFRPTF